ncbi:hypothetical protein [Halomonas cupida]|uniref:hypothetical protein n=1 Tax=Halomonas cupida TaxID=44933 RepID=UPI0011611A0A|nr:hypothetical protein [Halomonas cupida]
MTVDLLWGNTTIKQETESDKSEDDIAVLPHMRAGTGTSSIASGYPAIAIQEELAGAVEGKKIKIEVTVPDLDEMEVTLNLRVEGSFAEDHLFGYGYVKYDQGEDLKPSPNGTLDKSEMGEVFTVGGGYKISLEKSYEASRVSTGVSLEVVFVDNSGAGKTRSDEFVVRF